MKTEILIQREQSRIVAKYHESGSCTYILEMRYKNAMEEEYWAEPQSLTEKDKFKVSCLLIDDFVRSRQGTTAESNSWKQVWERWEDHPKFKEHREEMHRQGVGGAATILNSWIEEILERVEE